MTLAEQGRVSKLMLKILYIFSTSRGDPLKILSNDHSKLSIRRAMNTLLSRGLLSDIGAIVTVTNYGDFVEYSLTEKGDEVLNVQRRKIKEWIPFELPNLWEMCKWMERSGTTGDWKWFVRDLLVRLKGSEDKEFWEEVCKCALEGHPLSGRLVGLMIRTLDDEGVLTANLNLKWNKQITKCDRNQSQWQIIDRTTLYVPPSMRDDPPDIFARLLEKGKVDEVLEEGID